MAKAIQEIIKKYHQTEKGILAKRYARMKFDAKKSNLDIIPRHHFNVWSREDESFRHLFYDYQYGDYDEKLSPVLERIDVSKGFVWGNLRWITQKDKKRKRAKRQEKETNK